MYPTRWTLGVGGVEGAAGESLQCGRPTSFNDLSREAGKEVMTSMCPDAAVPQSPDSTQGSSSESAPPTGEGRTVLGAADPSIGRDVLRGVQEEGDLRLETFDPIIGAPAIQILPLAVFV